LAFEKSATVSERLDPRILQGAAAVTAPDLNPYSSPPALEPAQNRAIIFTQGQLATRWQRFLGALIDSLIGLPLFFIAGVAVGIVLVFAGFETDSDQFRLAAKVVGLAAGAGVFVALHGYLLATRGQTIGKYLLKTQIVSDSGDLVPLHWLIVKRYLPIWVVAQFPLVGPLFAIANYAAIFREERKCFHDQIAGTKVIQIE
jgi:uncharacterized RDD family membrane protein YckC